MQNFRCLIYVCFPTKYFLTSIKGDDNGTATTPLLIERQVPNHGGCKSPSVAVADASGATVLSPSSGGGGGNSQGAGAV